jgi:PAS domain-containing protein
LPTAFAPGERAAPEDVNRQAAVLSTAGVLPAMFDAMPVAVLLLNAQRQIVYANAQLAAFAPIPAPAGIVSLRPGEALACVHAAESAAGCGTTEFCRECGAVRAILSAQEGQPAVQECRITRRSRGLEEALDLRVQATPFQYADAPFTIFAVSDIGHEKRRLALERIFFHDLNNTAGIISNLAYLMGHAPEVAAELPVPQMLTQASDRLQDEIRTQRQLLAAENGELQLQLEDYDARAFLEDLAALYRRHQVAEGRAIVAAT